MSGPSGRGTHIHVSAHTFAVASGNAWNCASSTIVVKSALENAAATSATGTSKAAHVARRASPKSWHARPGGRGGAVGDRHVERGVRRAQHVVQCRDGGNRGDRARLS